MSEELFDVENKNTSFYYLNDTVVIKTTRTESLKEPNVINGVEFNPVPGDIIRQQVVVIVKSECESRFMVYDHTTRPFLGVTELLTRAYYATYFNFDWAATLPSKLRKECSRLLVLNLQTLSNKPVIYYHLPKRGAFEFTQSFSGSDNADNEVVYPIRVMPYYMEGKLNKFYRFTFQPTGPKGFSFVYTAEISFDDFTTPLEELVSPLIRLLDQIPNLF